MHPFMNRVSLWKNGIRNNFYISRLVLLTFIGPCPEGMEASHLNGNRLNNKLKNLVWETSEKNQQRKVEHGTDNRGEKDGNAKLTLKQVKEIRKNYHRFKYNRSNKWQLALKYNVSESCISQIVNYQRWVHIGV